MRKRDKEKYFSRLEVEEVIDKYRPKSLNELLIILDTNSSVLYYDLSVPLVKELQKKLKIKRAEFLEQAKKEFLNKITIS